MCIDRVQTLLSQCLWLIYSWGLPCVCLLIVTSQAAHRTSALLCLQRKKLVCLYTVHVINWVYINEYLNLQNLKLPYSNPSTQNKSSKSTISLIFLMITKSGWCVWNICHVVYFDIWYTKNLNPPIWNLLWLKSLWYVLNVSITEQWKNMIGIVREAI